MKQFRKRLAAGFLGMSLSCSAFGMPVLAANDAPTQNPSLYGFVAGSDQGTSDMIEKTGLQQLDYTDENGVTLSYWLYVPKNADGSVEEDLPLVVHMHGYSDGGKTRTVVNRHYGMGYQLLADRDNPVRKAILLMPQTPQATVNGTYLNDGNEQDRWVNLPGLTVNGNYWKRSNWDMQERERSQNLDAAYNLIKQVQNTYHTDLDRTYLSGESMGGCATWDLLLRDDEYLFAAAMPMCGIGDPTLAENASKTQIRMYHCKNDPTITSAAGRVMYEAMAPYGNVTYTEYDSTSHFCWNYAWSKTLDDDGNGVSNLEDAIDWMFNQSRKGTLDHTVDKAPLKQLMKKAEAASAADYDPKTLEKIARLAQEGETLLANVAATQEETARLCEKIAEWLSRKSSSLCFEQGVYPSQTWGDSHAWLAVDGNTSTFWDGNSNTLNPCVDIQLDHPVLLDSLTVTTRINASKYYKYEVYGSLDRKTWEKIGEKTSTAASTESGDTYTFDGDRLVSWIRLKGVESNVNNSFHIAEISATGSHAFLDLKERMETIDEILQEEEEKNVLPSSLKEQLETLSDSWQNVQLTVDTTDEQIEALIEQADSLIETVRSLPDMSLLKCALNKTHTLQLNEFAEGEDKTNLLTQAEAAQDLLDTVTAQQTVNAMTRDLGNRLLALRRLPDASRLPA